MNLAAPLVGLLTVLVILASLIPDARTDDQKIEQSGFELYTVRPDGLCLYVRVNSDGSHKRMKNNSRQLSQESLEMLMHNYID